MTTTIEDRVEEIQQQFKLNDPELAKLAEVSKQAVGRWRNMGAIPSSAAAFRLREKLGISEVWLISGKGSMLAKTKTDPLTDSILEISESLSDASRQQLLNYSRFLAEEEKRQTP